MWNFFCIYLKFWDFFVVVVINILFVVFFPLVRFFFYDKPNVRKFVVRVCDSYQLLENDIFMYKSMYDLCLHIIW